MNSNKLDEKQLVLCETYTQKHHYNKREIAKKEQKHNEN